MQRVQKEKHHEIRAILPRSEDGGYTRPFFTNHLQKLQTLERSRLAVISDYQGTSAVIFKKTNQGVLGIAKVCYTSAQLSENLSQHPVEDFVVFHNKYMVPA